LDIPKNTSATGSCGNDSQAINLEWYNKDNTTNKLTILFKKNITDSHFMIQNINLTVTPSDETFPSIKGNLKLSLTKVL
jgi:ssRNA-specific RNase YbeY (16S rRNA maturation enzyme)